MKSPFSTILVVSIILIVLAACVPLEAPSNSAPENSTSQSLEGTKWTLTFYGDMSAPQVVLLDSEVTADFAEGRISGTGGCNNYFAEYQTEGDQITTGNVGSTKMLCPDNVMQLEQEYIIAVDTVERYEIDGDELHLYYASGKSVLTFVSQS